MDHAGDRSAARQVRLLFAAGSAGLHLALSHWFYYHWVTTVGGIDGGILGFLTWTIPMIAGSLAHDILARTGKPGTAIGSLLGWGAGLMLLAYGLSCLNLLTPPNTPTHAGLCSWLVEMPFVPPTHPVNLWTMSQQAGSVTYLTFGAGLSLVLYAGFVWACDVRRVSDRDLAHLGEQCPGRLHYPRFGRLGLQLARAAHSSIGEGGASAVAVFGVLLRLRARPRMETHLLADVSNKPSDVAADPGDGASAQPPLARSKADSDGSRGGALPPPRRALPRAGYFDGAW